PKRARRQGASRIESPPILRKFADHLPEGSSERSHSRNAGGLATAISEYLGPALLKEIGRIEERRICGGVAKVLLNKRGVRCAVELSRGIVPLRVVTRSPVHSPQRRRDRRFKGLLGQRDLGRVDGVGHPG